MVTVSFRRRNNDVADERAWHDASADLLRTAVPWRTFRWYKGQQHYSGTYWSATMRDHVIYESRLELARLLFADFDPSGRHIVAQPFLMKATVGGKVRKHVPDFMLVTDQGPVVVDVKPLRRVANAEVAFTFDWVRQAVESRGWSFEVWSEPPSVELENIRFLAGYRRSWLFDAEFLEGVSCAGLDGVPLGEVSVILPDRPEPEVRAAVCHLLWKCRLAVDLKRPLSSSSVLRMAA